MNEYCGAILKSIETCQRKIHVVVDCANSVASKVTPRLLSQLGCKVTALNANIDGTFPSRSPEPTPETLTTTSKIAVAAGADLTVAHDADADRISILDENGQYVTNDRVLAFFAKIVLARHGPGTIATTVDTSFRIDQVAKKYGGEVRRTKLGKTQEFIKSHERNLRLCCEPYKIIDISWGSWGDGIYAACRLASSLANSGVSLSQLISDIPDYPQARVSYCCPNDIKEQAMKTVETVLLEEQEKQDVWTYDGVRVNYPDESWALVRASGTEPKIRLYCEAKSHKKLDQLLKKTSTLVHESIERRC